MSYQGRWGDRCWRGESRFHIWQQIRKVKCSAERRCYAVRAFSEAPKKGGRLYTVW